MLVVYFDRVKGTTLSKNSAKPIKKLTLGDV